MTENLSDIWNDAIREEQEYQNSLGKCIGYDDTECPNCGRLRVEKYSKGEKICEKCNWNITKQEYDLRRL